VADRADAADAGRQRGHLVERPPFDQLLEAAKLGDVEAGRSDPPGVVQLDSDLAMPLDAGNGVNGDSLAHVVSFLKRISRKDAKNAKIKKLSFLSVLCVFA
jgi:hypothetical protein